MKPILLQSLPFTLSKKTNWVFSFIYHCEQTNAAFSSGFGEGVRGVIGGGSVACFDFRSPPDTNFSLLNQKLKFFLIILLWPFQTTLDKIIPPDYLCAPKCLTIGKSLEKLSFGLPRYKTSIWHLIIAALEFSVFRLEIGVYRMGLTWQSLSPKTHTLNCSTTKHSELQL